MFFVLPRAAQKHIFLLHEIRKILVNQQKQQPQHQLQLWWFVCVCVCVWVAFFTSLITHFINFVSLFILHAALSRNYGYSYARVPVCIYEIQIKFHFFLRPSFSSCFCLICSAASSLLQHCMLHLKPKPNAVDVAVAIEIDAEFELATREEVAQLRRVSARYTQAYTHTHRGIC